MKVDVLILFAAWASIFLNVIALILIWRSKKWSYVNKMLWVLYLVLTPILGPVFLFVQLLIEKNKEEKKLKSRLKDRT
jgi:hypothetical protein